MRSHLNQYVFSPLFWIMTLLLLSLFLMVVLLFTPYGPKTVAFLADNSLKELNIKGVSGSVLSGLSVDEFAWNSDTGIEIKDINLNIDKYDIENKKIFADKLSVGELAIVLGDSKSPAPTFEKIELPDFGLPVNIDAELLQLDSLRIVKKIPDSDDTQTLLFQIEGIVLKNASIKDGKLTFESLVGNPTILDQPLKINVAKGSLNMNQPHELTTSGEISFDHPELGNLQGQIQMGGTLTEYILGADLVFKQKQVGSGTFSVKGEGDYKNIKLSDIQISSNHGKVAATGNVIWDPEIRLNFDIDSKELKTSEFLPDWPVTADAKIKYSGSIIDTRLENTVDIIKLEGDFRGEKLIVEGQIVDKQGFIRAENLDIQLGDNTVLATGAVTEPLNLRLNIDAKNLSQILPELSGNIKGEAIVKGEYKTPEIESNVSANELSYGDFKQGKETLTLKTNVVLEEDESLQIKNLVATLGKNEVKLTGKATEPFALNWEVNAQALNQISPLVVGKIEGGGVLKGTSNDLTTTLKLKADKLVINELKQGKDSLLLEGEVKLKDKLILLNSLTAKSGTNSINVTGQASEPVDINIEVNAKKLSEVSPDIAGRVTGTASVTGPYNSPNIKTNLVGSNLFFKQQPLTQADVKLKGEVEIREGFPVVKQMNAQIGNNKIQVSGKATEPFDLNWRIEGGNLNQISKLLQGRINGDGKLTGTQKNLVTTLKLKGDNLVYDEFKQGKDSIFLDGEVVLNEKNIQLKSILAKSGTNSLAVSGQVSEPLGLNLKVNAQNLSEVSPDITGRVTGTVSVNGAYASPNIKTNLLGSNLSVKQQRLTQADIKLQGEVDIRDGVPVIKQMNTQIGNNTIQVTGKASSPFDLNWNVEGKNLKQISSDLSGNLVVKGQLQGTIDRPIINASGDANNLKFDAFSLGSGKFTASTKNGIYRIKSDLKKLKNADQEVKSAKIELNGTIESHAITAKVNHSDAKVDLKANGGWKNQRWNGSVKTLKLGDTKAGDWRLQKPTRVSISKDGFNADKLCFSSDKTQACSTASFSKASGLTAKGTLKKTPLSLIKPFLPEGLTLNGDIQGSYDIKQNKGKPTGFIKFKLPNNSFSFKGEDGDEQSFSYENAELNATINNRTINTEAKMKIINRGVFSSKAKIKLSPKNGKHTINGSANFDVPNINFAQRFIPRSRGLRGAMSSKLTFTGLLSKPQIKGKAEIKNAYLRLPEAGTEITNINLNLRADKPGQAIINGKMLMGKGVLNVSGDMDLKDIAKWKARIKISGKNIRFMNTNEIKAVMSPDINLNLTPQLVGITGRIDIPEADIRLKNIPETSIDESTDTFIIGESKVGEQVTSVKIRPKVLISLGKKVRMDAFGLEAKLSGDVNVTHNRRDILANGSLRVQDGKFQAYGQDLEIANGRLIFNGSPRLIGMDIRATRTIDKQVVGIHLGGTLLSPKSTLYADPTLEEESEILSYLITGNTLSSASGQESALLLSAVRGLGVTGSGSIIQQIGSAFGLDDVNIVTKDDLKKSELALGKRLGSRLYVRYLIGLFDQTQKIAIEYKINDVLSLEAQTTADDFGLDFIYEIETN